MDTGVVETVVVPPPIVVALSGRWNADPLAAVEAPAALEVVVVVEF